MECTIVLTTKQGYFECYNCLVKGYRHVLDKPLEGQRVINPKHLPLPALARIGR